MKLAKKITTVFVALCMVFSFSMLAVAADGKLMFTDPSTEVGQVVEVKGVVEVAATYGLEDMTINLKYDTTMLKFKNGAEITETEPGRITFSRKGIENPNRVEYLMYFDVLKEGTTKIEIVDCNVWTTTDEKVYPVLGNSTVTIAPGEAPVEPPVDEPVDTPDEPADDIEIKISDTTTITLLSEISEVTLPSRYLATTVTVDGVDFPAWRDTEKANLCILYALNSNGEKALYQYDSTEGTYQRFEVPTKGDAGEDKGSIMDMLGGLFEDNMDYVVIGAGGTFILLLIIILVLSIKLYNRNAELDELYEEYDLYEDDEDEEEVKDKKAEKKAEKKIEKSKPVVVNEPAEFANINTTTVDDIVIAVDDETLGLEEADEDDEIEVEFYEEAPAVKDPEMEAIALALAKDDDEEEYFDDDLDLDFEVDFIDLDD